MKKSIKLLFCNILDKKKDEKFILEKFTRAECCLNNGEFNFVNRY